MLLEKQPISISPLPAWCMWLDWFLTPIMYLVQGSLRERPQQTHFWNNRRLSRAERNSLRDDLFLTLSGDPAARRRWFGPIPRFHIPLLGGWKRYVVIKPDIDDYIWYVGWVTGDAEGVSLLPLRGPVRLLLGPDEVSFFGVDSCRRQINLRLVGEGFVGAASPDHRQIPLR